MEVSTLIARLSPPLLLTVVEIPVVVIYLLLVLIPNPLLPLPEALIALSSLDSIMVRVVSLEAVHLVVLELAAWHVVPAGLLFLPLQPPNIRQLRLPIYLLSISLVAAAGDLVEAEGEGGEDYECKHPSHKMLENELKISRLIFIISKQIAPTSRILLGPELLLHEVIKALPLNEGLVVILEEVLNLPLLLLFPDGVARLHLAIHVIEPDIELLAHVNHVHWVVLVDWLDFRLFNCCKIIYFLDFLRFLHDISIGILDLFLALIGEPAVLHLLPPLLHHPLLGLLDLRRQRLVLVAVGQLGFGLLHKFRLVLRLRLQTIIHIG